MLRTARHRLGLPPEYPYPARVKFALLDAPYSSFPSRTIVCRKDSCSVEQSLLTPPPPDKPRGTRMRPAASVDSAIEARTLSGQSHVCAKTPARPEHGTNPDPSGDAQSKAGSPRNPWTSGPALSAPKCSCGRLRLDYAGWAESNR